VNGLFIRETEQGVEVILDQARNFFKLITPIAKLKIGPFRITAKDGDGQILAGPMSIVLSGDELSFSFTKVCDITFSKKTGCTILFNSKTNTSFREMVVTGELVETTLSALTAEVIKSFSLTSQKVILSVGDILINKCASFSVAAGKMAVAVQDFTVNSKFVSMVASDGVTISSGLKSISLDSKAGVVISGKAKKSKAVPTSVTIEGDTMVKVDAPSIQIGSFINPAILGNETFQLLSQLLKVLNTFSGAMGTAAVGPCAPMQAPAQTLTSQLVPIVSKLNTILSKTVMIG
jgi:hypothetical protein